MPAYDYLCTKCNEIIEIRHSMSSTETYNCDICNTILEKQISSTFYFAGSIAGTLQDKKESEHTKKVKDPERAIRMRKRAFGHDAVGDPSMQTDPKHIVKRGRTLGGQQTEVDKKELYYSLEKMGLEIYFTPMPGYILDSNFNYVKNKEHK